MTWNNFIILTINAIAHATGFSVLLYNLCNLFVEVKIKFILFWPILFVTALITSVYLEAYMLLAMFIISIIFLFIIKISKLSALISSVITVGICYINLVIINYIYYALHIPTDLVPQLRNSIAYNFAMSAVYTILAFIFSFIIHIIQRKIHPKFSEHPNIWGSFIYVIISGVLFLLGLAASVSMFTVVIGMDAVKDYLISCDILVIIQIVFAVIVGIFIVFSSLIMYTSHRFTEYRTKEISVEKDKEITELYKREIQNMYDEISDFKHDYMKIYSSMSILIANDKIDELKRYFFEEITPIQDKILSEKSISHNLTLIRDSILQGLIYTYVLKARNTNTNFYVAIDESIPTSNSISSLNLSRLMGILLDNAFEEVEKTNDGIVRLSIYNRQNETIYIVKNSCNKTVNILDIFSNAQSTKGEGRGRGLRILKSICDKHKNILFKLNYENRFFTAELVVKN